ncbi:MAG: hypothetical protein M1829_003036 [Trizodia sp. TS-e1964]|nr:MAG: hypothetical protein M1829_003036 [Trizodia sp. TS-e1964]
MIYHARPANTGYERTDNENVETHCLGWGKGTGKACGNRIGKPIRDNPRRGRESFYCHWHRYQLAEDDRTGYSKYLLSQQSPPRYSPRYTQLSPQSSPDSSPAPSIFSKAGSPFSSPETSPETTPDPTPLKSYIGRKPSSQNASKASSPNESILSTPSKSHTRRGPSAHAALSPDDSSALTKSKKSNEMGTSTLKASVLSTPEELPGSTSFLRRNSFLEAVSIAEESPPPTPSKPDQRREPSSRSEILFSPAYPPETSLDSKSNTSRKHSTRPGILPLQPYTAIPSPLSSPESLPAVKPSTDKKSCRASVKPPHADTYINLPSPSLPVASPPITSPPLTSPSPTSSFPRHKPTSNTLTSQPGENYKKPAPKPRFSFLSYFTCCFSSRKPQHHKSSHMDDDGLEKNYRLPSKMGAFPSHLGTTTPMPSRQRDNQYTDHSYSSACWRTGLPLKPIRKTSAEIVRPVQSSISPPLVQEFYPVISGLDDDPAGESALCVGRDAIASEVLPELYRPIPTAPSPGYIYLLWLTDLPLHQIPDLSPSSLLDSSQGKSGPVTEGLITLNRKDRLTGDLKGRQTNPNKILVKIGRSNRPLRRITQLNNGNCGFNYSLIRTYPNISVGASSRRGAWKARASPEQSQTPLMIPFVSKVEKRIHRELFDLRVYDMFCECGRRHREIFEIENSTEGMERVHQVIEKWALWGNQESEG